MNLIFKYSILLFLSAIIISCDRENITPPLTDDGIPPIPPGGLNIWLAYDGQIGIEWIRNTIAGTRGYNIYRSINDTNNFQFLAYTNNNYYLDTGLEYNVIYNYKLTSLDIFNNEGDYSQIISAKPENKFKPITPFDIKINARNWKDSIYIHLNWIPTRDNDIRHYNIYRDTMPSFEISPHAIHDSTIEIFYSDTADIEILKDYYYKITAVDNGYLESKPTAEVSDIIFNKPEIIFPQNESEINTLIEFEIKLISKPAGYKIVIQKNEFFDIIKEINFSSDETDVSMKISAFGAVFQPYRNYYWRVITYSGSSEPNSFTGINKFRIIP